MIVALTCTALLGLLVFGLGLRVSLLRTSTKTNAGSTDDPADPLTKAIRAHGNASEYCPMMAVLMLGIAFYGASTWMLGVFVLATVSRYLHAAGMLLSPTLAEPQPLRIAGALGTYVFGLLLVVAAFVALA